MSRITTSGLRRIAFVGNSLPRLCGIATFTCDLCRSIDHAAPGAECFIVPINDIESGYDYPPEVWFDIQEKELGDYRRAADFLNVNDVDVVCVQHEFGLFGGAAGSHLLTLLKELRMPVVTTMHTILKQPSEDQRRVVEALGRYSDRLVTMSARGAEFLRDVYDMPPDKVVVIPHGIPDVPFVDPSFYKDNFAVEGRQVLLTFGLLGPDKGIEQVISALPMIVQRRPDVVYVIVGATHPTLKREQGEIYRISLQQLARQCNVEGHVVFHNRFVSLEELKEFLGAADIYVTPYLNKAQICSGTLAYAVGAGKAVISTPYWYAEELLADDRGRLVPFNDPGALAETVLDLLEHPVDCNALRKRAYLYGRQMTWEKVAQQYLEQFERVRSARAQQPSRRVSIPTLDRQPGELPLIRLVHLKRMTDDTGLLQHAVYCFPNYAEGYCTDDNARALILVTLLEDLIDGGAADLPGMASRYIAFLNFAYNQSAQRFRNFLAYNRGHWLDEAGSEDSHGRSLWALGIVVRHTRRDDLRTWAVRLFEQAVIAESKFTSPRSWAFALLGLDEYLHRFSGDRIAQTIRRDLAGRLLSLYHSHADANWRWFEPDVTYCNAKLPHALLISGYALKDKQMIDAALRALRWLVEIQTADAGHFLPIGSSGFYHRGGDRARFDQQPIEAHATVSAALAAHRITGEADWWSEAQRAFEWFIGRNDLGRPIYDPTTGGCHDGLQPDGVNRNQGAESTLAYLLALAEMRLAEQDVASQKRDTGSPQAAASLVEIVAAPLSD